MQLRVRTGRNQELFDRAMEMEWKINGQTLHFGSKPIEVKPDSTTIDTIFYRRNLKSQWDTILCNIREPKNYLFVYNDCCDAFDVQDAILRRRTIGKVIFKLTEKNKNVFLGTLGESGVLINYPATTDTLVPICNSPMPPNIYQVTFSTIKICNDTVNCDYWICLSDEEEKKYNNAFGSRTVSEKMNIHYVALDNEPLLVIYDPKTNKITLK
jgi:hypothetical protein